MVSGYHIVECRFRLYQKFISGLLHASVTWTSTPITQMNFVDYFLGADSSLILNISIESKKTNHIFK